MNTNPDAAQPPEDAQRSLGEACLDGDVAKAEEALDAELAKLEAKRFPIGPSIGIKDPVVTDGIADEVDYIWYDQEHSTMVRPACSNPQPQRRTALLPPAARRAPTSCRTTSSQRMAAACQSSSASPAPTSATPPRPE